jgi:uncharacterized protein (TIGR03437 family)
MQRNRKVLFAKIAVVMAAVPILLWAHEYGPDPGYTNVPGEKGTCNQTGCHVGSALNSGAGSVSVAFASGTTYSPGVKQHLVVTVADPTQRAWGFQLTTRVGTGSAMAGSFAFTDANTLLMCAQPNLQVFQAQCQNVKADGCANSTSSCPAGQTLQYIEHSLTGYTASLGHTGSQTFEFDWTPPATNVGNVNVYVSANAANGDLQPTGDHIYNKSITLTAAAAGNTPTIAAGGVVNGASFVSGIVPGSWLTIQGTNLATGLPAQGFDTWDRFIVNGKLPTSLDGTTVSIAGTPAYVYFVSPTQINVQAPDVGTGPVPVTVTTANGTSTSVTATVATAAPAFFLWPNSQAVATRADFSLAAKSGTFSSPTTAAKPGDVLILWGTGFGPTTPVVAAGIQVPTGAFNCSPVTVKVGTTSPAVFGCALSPGFAGLYQVVITLPSTMADGDYPLTATVNGVTSPSGVILSIKN